MCRIYRSATGDYVRICSKVTGYHRWTIPLEPGERELARTKAGTCIPTAVARNRARLPRGVEIHESEK